MKHASLAILAVALLAGCTKQLPAPVETSVFGAADPNAPVVAATPTVEPTPVPTATPRPTRVVRDFEADAVGSVPADFVDITKEGTPPAWVYAGNWKVSADEHGNHVLLHDDVRPQPNVSFMRYRGDLPGSADGQLPDSYYAEVQMRPISSPDNYPPTGDQGVQFYYLAYDQYIEVVVKPTVLEVWECRNGEPHSSKGWKRLWYYTMATNAGDVRRIGALVDKQAGTFAPYLNGEQMALLVDDMVKPVPSWLTLRGIGNVVSFDQLVIEAR